MQSPAPGSSRMPAPRKAGLVGDARHAAKRTLHRAIGLKRRLPEASTAVALTFDDGPDPSSTPHLLGTLGELGVQATFFLVGERATKHPDLVARIAEGGHAIGSHSFSHPVPTGMSASELFSEFCAGRRAVEAVVGHTVRLFRPPQGKSGPAASAAMVAAGLRPWNWSRDPLDWMPGVTTDEIMQRTEDLAAGDVILLHDHVYNAPDVRSQDRSATLAAVPLLVERARAQGLSLIRLPQR